MPQSPCENSSFKNVGRAGSPRPPTRRHLVAGGNVQTFLNGLQGKNPLGVPVKGWKVFNKKFEATWLPMAASGIRQMQREVPIYNASCAQ
jgi:hypothetical protein